MGAGDEVMAGGHAHVVSRRLGGRPVAITDVHDRPRWHPLWEGLPWVAHPRTVTDLTPKIRNASNCRPYIQYPFTPETGWTFRDDWKARDHVGTIYFTDVEKDLVTSLYRTYGPYIVVEPSPVLKNPNRQWKAGRWQGVIAELRRQGHTVLQPFHKDSEPFAGAIPIPTKDFREAAVMLCGALLYLGVEGGLTHAAAALTCPAVVLYGGCVSVDILGYPEHYNLVDTSPATPCGKWAPCAHCAEAWDRITVARVMACVQQWQRDRAQRHDTVLAELPVGSALH